MDCSLPATGVSVVPVVIIAIVLLVLGAVGVVIARRRKGSVALIAIILLAVSLGAGSVVATPGIAQAAPACTAAPPAPVTSPTPVVTPPVAVPDLTDTITTDYTDIGVTDAATEDPTVTVTEVAGVATSGPIAVLIPVGALPTGALSSPSYDPTVTTNVYGDPVDNSLFTFDAAINPGYYTFTTNAVIPAHGSLAFTFTVDYTSGGRDGEIDADVQNGSGGETNFANNHAFVKINYSTIG